MKNQYEPIHYVEDDGLEIMEIGGWSLEKYRLVAHYCNILTTAMRFKWNLIYLDMFAGPGYVKIKGTNNIIKNSALIAMDLKFKFDHYILNDASNKTVKALDERIRKLHPDVSFKIYNEDANNCIEQILHERPSFHNGKRNLTFCFLDPFSLNLNFNTIQKLSKENVDLLVLHALNMDGDRNLVYYQRPENNRVELYTNNKNWRTDFESSGIQRRGFVKFLSDQFDKSIEKLGYLKSDKILINNNSGMGIYHLGFYSKHELGLEFFEKIKSKKSNQLGLF